jgi:methionyl-tRNA formyltransferase
VSGIVFLAADTSRSMAYAQAMQFAGVVLTASLVLHRKQSGVARDKAVAKAPVADFEDCDVFLPNLSIPLGDTCRNISASVDELSVTGINDPHLVRKAAEAAPDLLVYSGFAGEIVGPKLLELGAPLLHIHGGWVPEYRGSTNNYYSLLERGRCGASAILLSANLDEGPVIARRWYPPPPPGVDIDYMYDNAIRADLLVRVLGRWAESREHPLGLQQSVERARMFYVIHPVLKHLAMLSLTAIDDTHGAE